MGRGQRQSGEHPTAAPRATSGVSLTEYVSVENGRDYRAGTIGCCLRLERQRLWLSSRTPSPLRAELTQGVADALYAFAPRQPPTRLRDGLGYGIAHEASARLTITLPAEGAEFGEVVAFQIPSADQQQIAKEWQRLTRSRMPEFILDELAGADRQPALPSEPLNTTLLRPRKTR